MLKRILVIALPVGLIALFIAVMLSAAVLKHPLGSADDVPAWLSRVEAHVMDEQWQDALEGARKLADAFNRVTVRVQFSAQLHDVLDLRAAIARAEGFIRAQNRAGAMAELAEARTLWDRIGSRH
ncbi:MAG TPA: hypothetical protein PLM74_03780 [Bacillota bacterium]|jgi:hypothetical protein|nr:hypothetical protein [Bacillota bacterium]